MKTKKALAAGLCGANCPGCIQKTHICWFEREKSVCHSFVSALESCSPGAAAVAPIKQHQPSQGRDGWCCYTLGGYFIHSRCRRCFHHTRAAGCHVPYWNNACRGNWLPWGKAFFISSQTLSPHPAAASGSADAAGRCARTCRSGCSPTRGSRAWCGHPHNSSPHSNRGGCSLCS